MPFTEYINLSTSLGIMCALVISQLGYNMYFHPLHSFPGPWYCKISRLWYCIQVVRGRLSLEVKRLHDIYGDVVQIAPNELSYNSPDAWSSIYGRNIRKGNTTKPSPSGTLFPKDPTLYGPLFEQSKTIFDAEGNDYNAGKRSIQHAFTKKSLLTKEAILTSYVNSAVESVELQLRAADVVDVVPIFGNALFDIICKLTVDEDLHAINPKGQAHPAVCTLTSALEWIYIPVMVRHISRTLAYPLELCASSVGKGLMHLGPVGPLLSKRQEKGGSNPDFVSVLKQGKQEDKASQLQVINNATSLIAAGTETTASLLCGAVYHILSNPAVLLSLCQEIRGAADNASDLNLETVCGMKYLRACLDETMRVYPPVVGTLPRVVDGDGAYICDQFVPPNTVVGINHWATYRSHKNFSYPDEYRPDRWLNVEEGEYIGDRRKAFQPFGYGPRKCIANELASMDSTLLLARLLWKFDMELDAASHDWANNQKGFITPYKPALWVKLKRVATP